MIAPVQKYKVSLFGEIHALVSDDSETLVLGSVHVVDALMKEIAQQTRCTDIKQLALLAALHLAQQQLKDQSKLMNLIDNGLEAVVS